MKKFIFLTLLCLSLNLAAREKPFDGFADYVSKENLEYFAKDLGGLLGSGTYTTGRVLGWGGFQVGPRVAVVPKLNEKNTALGAPEEVDALILPWIQADIGMPWRIDGFIRAGSYDGLTMAGGGFRWGLTRPVENTFSFQSMIVVSAHMAVAESFAAAHYNASLVLSMTTKYFTPYIGGGADAVHLTVKDSAILMAEDDKSVVTYSPRATAGLNIKLPWYLDLSLAANYASYGLGAEGSFSLRF